MNKFNVLFIASARNMGLSFNLTRLAIALQIFGHEVTVVSETGEEEEGLFEELTRRGIKHYALQGLDAISVKNTVNAARTMGKIIDCENVDVVHAQGIRQLIVAFFAAKIFTHRKKIAVVTSTHSTLAGSPYENATLLVESFLLNMCTDLAMPVAQSVANRLVSFGLIPNKVVTVHNGIDLELIDEAVCSGEHPPLLPDDLNRSSTILVGYFARLVQYKGHQFLIKAISEVSKEFPNIRLIIAGDGPLRGELESLSRQLGVEEKVLFTGKIRHKSVYELLKQVDIYAFPSSGELFPLAILEAMAAGNPIVATSVGGVNEVIKDGETGILVPPKEHAKLAEGIKELINDPLRAEQMGKKSRKLVEENFSLHKIAYDLTKCYELCVRRKRYARRDGK